MKKIYILFIFLFFSQAGCDFSDPDMMDLLREIKDQNTELLDEIKSSKSKSDSLINEIKTNSALQEDLLNMVTFLQSDISKIVQEISKLTEKLDKQGVDIEEVKSQLADLQKKYEQIIIQLENLQKLSMILGEIESLKSQILDLNNKSESIIASLEENKEKIEELEAKIEDIQTQLNENLSKISQLTSQLTNSEANVESILNQIAELQKELKNLLANFEDLLGIDPEEQGKITSLDCISIINEGNLTKDQVALNVNTKINYEGGNGKNHEGQIVVSTGVLGLSATLSPGSFADGNGSLTYVITGTPSSSGLAKFAINIGGQTCEITRSVGSTNSNISALNCNSAVNTGATGQQLNKLVNGYQIPGAKTEITYLGGDGSNHTGQIVNSTGVIGLTATLLPGKFNFGTGNLIYTITGTPSSSGKANFELSIGGQTCVLSWDVNDNQASRYPNGTVFCEFPTEVVEVVNPKTGKIWMDRNLGAVRAAQANNDTQSYGDLYQWGRRADGHQCRNSKISDELISEVEQPTHPDFFASGYYDWIDAQNDNFWQGINGINNPCPTGFRLPTEAEWIEEAKSWSSPNGAFESNNKLPFGGTRSNLSNGEILNVGKSANYWSSSTGSQDNIRNFNSIIIYFRRNRISEAYFDSQMRYANRASGQSVRCIKD